MEEHNIFDGEETQPENVETQAENVETKAKNVDIQVGNVMTQAEHVEFQPKEVVVEDLQPNQEPFAEHVVIEDSSNRRIV